MAYSLSKVDGRYQRELQPRRKAQCTCSDCRRWQIELEALVDNPDIELESGEAEIIGRSDSRRQRPTADMTKAPFRYICNLEYNWPNFKPTAVGSGFLVGPSTLLTAGHVVVGKDPQRLRVIPGRRGEHEPFGRVAAKSVQLPPNYVSCGGDDPTDFRDYAIVTLRSPIGEQAGYWSFEHRTRSYDTTGTSITTRPSIGRGVVCNVSGYPLDKPDKMGCGGGGLRCNVTDIRAPSRNVLCGTHQYSSVGNTVQMLANNRVLVIDNDVCTGHSGSPVWIRRTAANGGRVCIGMWVCGAARGNSCVFMHKELRDFIRANAH
jgi:glutamyl endopeptidase